MKAILDTKTGELTVGKKKFPDMEKSKQDEIINSMRQFILKNAMLDDYETDCMWMSYRYSIGSKTIATQMMASDIAKHCYGRMTDERSVFNAYDINRCIEDKLRFGKPDFHFPITSLNRLYTTAFDIVCEFIEDNNITCKEDFLKYRTVNVKQYDNERGYTTEVETWDEYLNAATARIFREYHNNASITYESARNMYNNWKRDNTLYPEIKDKLNRLRIEEPNPDYWFSYDLECLMVWNDLCHLFDKEHHHKCILTDGSECEYFWTWAKKCNEEGYQIFGYKKIRVPLSDWNGHFTVYIPEESIKEEIY